MGPGALGGALKGRPWGGPRGRGDPTKQSSTTFRRAQGRLAFKASRRSDLHYFIAFYSFLLILVGFYKFLQGFYTNLCKNPGPRGPRKKKLAPG